MNNETEQIFIVNAGGNPTAAIVQKGDAVPGTTQVNLENVQDFSTVCRTCATITEFVIPIFEGEGLQNNLADKIQKHLPIQVLENDALPRVVCYQCASTLLAWHELVKCCVQADEALKARLAQLQQTPATVLMESEWSSSNNEQNKLFYANVDNVLTEYLMSINMDGEISTYVCQKCPNHTHLPDVKALADHVREVHRLNERNSLEKFIKDNIAFEETLNWDNSDRDADSDAELPKETEVLPNFFCPFCESIFSSTTRLVCHLNTHIEVCIDKGVTCCDNVYNDKRHFVDHFQESHVTKSSKDVSNVCKSCGYQAADAEDLHSHVTENHEYREMIKKRIRTSARNQKSIPAVCPECNKTFANKYNMFIHMKSHNETKESFRCEQCGKTYSNQGNLTHHQKHSHAGILNHICSYCGEAFPTRRAREVHLRIHTGVKPFTCTYCQKSFRAKNSLDRHLDMHLDVRKYACDLCPKRFRKRTHLNYHLSTHRKSTSNLVVNLWPACRDGPSCSYNSAGLDIPKQPLDTGQTYEESIETVSRHEDDTKDEDDEPLSSVATRKSQAAYSEFYSALVNFRNHFFSDHDKKCKYPDFTDSSDSEAVAEDLDTEGNLDSYDDLTQSNMRKDKMDEETRIELSQVQIKINGKVYYTCKICGKNLSSSHTYVYHKRIHTGERPCVCHVCGKQFRAPNGLQRHLTETHERLRRHSCHYCPKNFVNMQNLKQHMRIHTGERPFVCPQCGKRFTQSGSLHVHVKTHTDHFPFECAECGAKFRLRTGLSRHRLKHSGERPHVCTLCQAAFRHKHELSAHSAAHSDAKPHACGSCGAAFRQRRALRHHAKRIHESDVTRDITHTLMYPQVPQEQEPKTEPTETTTKREESPFSQAEDKKIIVDEDRRHVTCPICQKQVSKGSWRRHERCHSNDRRYRCDACGLGFTDSGNLARHARALHAKHRPYACTTCSHTFSRNSHLQDHIKSKHSSTKDFICDSCGKASKSKAALRMHKRRHDSEYRVRCMECGAGFKRRGELVAHVSVHTGERAHACPCGRAFRLRGQLTRHARTHQQQKAIIITSKATSPPRYAEACAGADADADVDADAGAKPCPYCRGALPAALLQDHLVDAHAHLLFHCQECDSYVDRKDFILHMSFHCVQYSKATQETDASDRPVKTEGKRAKRTMKKEPKDENENTKRKKQIPIAYTKREHGNVTETIADKVQNIKTDKSGADTEENDFSDHSDGEYGFGPLPESVFDAIEDSQDNAPRETTSPDDSQPETVTDQQKSEAQSGKVANYKKPRTCPICFKTYNASSSYFYHMKYFHRQSKEHACDVCGRKFGTRGCLAQHATIHTGERRLECNRCGKRFRTKASLYIHSQTHTTNAGWSCEVCGRVFRWRAALARHVTRHTAARAHACPVCPRAFSVRYDLIRHARTHERGEFACDYCKLTFAQPRYLRVHLLKKHNINSKNKSVKQTSQTDLPGQTAG